MSDLQPKHQPLVITPDQYTPRDYFKKSSPAGFGVSYETDHANYDGSPYQGDVLIPESLQTTLVKQTQGEFLNTLYGQIPKGTTNVMNDQFNEIISLGMAFNTGFTGDIVPNSYPDIRRRFSQTKVYMTAAKLTMFLNDKGFFAAQPGARETVEWSQGIMLQSKLAYDLFYGDTSVNPLGVDGFFTRLANDTDVSSDHIINAQGHALTYDHISLASQIIAEEFGMGAPTGWVSPEAINYHQVWLNQNRRRIDSMGFPTGEGSDVRVAKVPQGNVYLQVEPYLQRSGIRRRSQGAMGTTADSDMAPDAPTVSTALTTGTSGDLFDVAFTGRWWIRAKNGVGGESAPVHLTASAAQAITTSQNAVVVVKDETSDVNRKATGFVIYRCSEAEYAAAGNTSQNATKIFEVSNLDASGIPKSVDVTITDRNYYRSECTHALFGILNKEQTAELKFMKSGMIKVDLAMTNLTKPWVQMLLPNLQIKSPFKFVMVKNIGRDVS